MVTSLWLIWSISELRSHGWFADPGRRWFLNDVLGVAVSGTLFGFSIALLLNAIVVSWAAIVQRGDELVFHAPFGWKRAQLSNGLSVVRNEMTVPTKFGLLERISGVPMRVVRLAINRPGQPQWMFPAAFLNEDASVVVRRISEVLEDYGETPPLGPA